jgi:hypothetical protein
MAKTQTVKLATLQPNIALFISRLLPFLVHHVPEHRANAVPSLLYVVGSGAL